MNQPPSSDALPSSTETPKDMEEAVARLLTANDREGAVAFLRANPYEVPEFFLRVYESHLDQHKELAIRQLAGVMEEALGLEKPDTGH